MLKEGRRRDENKAPAPLSDLPKKLLSEDSSGFKYLFQRPQLSSVVGGERFSSSMAFLRVFDGQDSGARRCWRQRYEQRLNQGKVQESDFIISQAIIYSFGGSAFLPSPDANVSGVSLEVNLAVRSTCDTKTDDTRPGKSAATHSTKGKCSIGAMRKIGWRKIAEDEEKESRGSEDVP